MKNKFRIILIFIIFSLAFFLRFYKLDSIPAGLHADAASQGYNAFSLLNSGKDRFGESFPILFRAFGYYQPPLYTYLTIIPVAFFGNSQFSAHFVSALSGAILVLITFLITLALFDKNKSKTGIALISATVVAVAPWSVFFSRLAIEANLGLLLLATSLLFFVYSLKRTQFILIASLLLGVSTHAYYSERLIAVIFLPAFLFLFRKTFFTHKKTIITALLLFTITQLPHLIILSSGAFAQRFNQVSDFGANLSPQSKIINIMQTVLNNYLIYFSPKNLFFDSDTNLGRTMPGLSVFYNWLIVPFFIGMWYLLKNRFHDFSKILGLLLIVTPLPASFTSDFFYPLRTLDFLWVMSLIITLGIFQIFLFLKSKTLRLSLLFIFISYSLLSLYISYFILFRYEKASDYGYAYIHLMDKLNNYRKEHIIIDSARDPGIGTRLAYLRSYPPGKIQAQLRSQMKTPYYSGFVNTNELYKIDNIEIKTLDFGDACKKDLIIIGDILSISSQQAKEHALKKEFEVSNLDGKIALQGYSTHPEDLKNCSD